jgi:hypothetical protein
VWQAQLFSFFSFFSSFWVMPAAAGLISLSLSLAQARRAEAARLSDEGRSRSSSSSRSGSRIVAVDEENERALTTYFNICWGKEVFSECVEEWGPPQSHGGKKERERERQT